jgi:hypothetical protein
MNLLSKQEGLKYRLEGKILHVEPCPNTKECSWSVFDITGSEKCNGKLNASTGPVINLGILESGVYEICLMDGVRLRAARFRLT